MEALILSDRGFHGYLYYSLCSCCHLETSTKASGTLINVYRSSPYSQFFSEPRLIPPLRVLCVNSVLLPFLERKFDKINSVAKSSKLSRPAVTMNYCAFIPFSTLSFAEDLFGECQLLS